MEVFKKYEFIKWNDWDHCIADSIKDFHQIYNLYPNILLANRHTYSQIDFITSINEEKKNNLLLVVDENIGNYLDSLISENDEFGTITSFSEDNCELFFAIATEPELTDKEFVLLYDDDPDGDGDEDDLPKPEPEQKGKKVSV
ncbi:MAG: hypothetical protein WCR01_10615 [Bacteroidota bacterium]